MFHTAYLLPHDCLPQAQLHHHPLRPPPQVRPVAPDDQPRLARYVENLSPPSQQMRFHAVVRGCTPGLLAVLAGTATPRQQVLVASLRVDGGEVLVGEARYVVDCTGTQAEFAISVADAWRGTGVARQLMSQLLQRAADEGLHWLHGDVLACNARMLAFVERMGFSVDRQRDPWSEPCERTMLHVERCVQPRPFSPATAATRPARGPIALAAAALRAGAQGLQRWLRAHGRGHRAHQDAPAC